MEYFGTEVTAENLEELLRTAVKHTPPTDNRDLMFDPDGWASGLLDKITGTPLEAKALLVFDALARSGSPDEMRFAAHHDLGRDLVPPDALLDALDRASALETRAALSRSLGRALRAGRLAYTPRLRAVIGEEKVQDELLGSMVLHDHAVFLGALDDIFGKDPAAAKMRAYFAVTGLNHAEVSRLRDELAASSLPDDVRAATLEALDDVLAHPSTPRTGSVRW